MGSVADRPSSALVPRTTAGATGLAEWIRAVPISRRTAALLTLVSLGMLVTVVFTASGGVGLLAGLVLSGTAAMFGTFAVVKSRPAPEREQLVAAPGVVDERARRVRSVLEHLPQSAGTFDGLRHALGWTDEALVTALLHMKGSGLLIEDLDLDSGQWIYRLGFGDGGESGTHARPPTLEERRDRLLGRSGAER